MKDDWRGTTQFWQTDAEGQPRRSGTERAAAQALAVEMDEQQHDSKKRGDDNECDETGIDDIDCDDDHHRGTVSLEVARTAAPWDPPKKGGSWADMTSEDERLGLLRDDGAQLSGHRGGDEDHEHSLLTNPSKGAVPSMAELGYGHRTVLQSRSPPQTRPRGRS